MRKPTDSSRFLAWLFLILFSLALLLSLLAPLLPSPILHYLFAPVCHQESERCFVVNGLPVAVCVRCVAIYAGLAVGGLLYLQFRYTLRSSFVLLSSAVILNLLDYFLESLGFYENLFAIRILVGFLLGLSIANFVLVHSKNAISPQPA